jgi:hypothetical protein
VHRLVDQFVEHRVLRGLCPADAEPPGSTASRSESDPAGGTS